MDRCGVGAQVGRNDRRVCQHVVGWTAHEHGAEFHGDQPITESGEHRDVVFDDQHGCTRVVADPAEQRPECLGLALGDPGRRLVEQHEDRVLGQQAAEFDDPPGAGGQHRRRGVAVATQAEECDEFADT